MLPILLPGDLILTSANTWLSKSIRWFQKPLSQDATSEYSHVAFSIVPGMIAEQLWFPAISKLKKYENQSIKVWRLPLTDEERVSFSQAAMEAIKPSSIYPGGKIVLFALDSLNSRVTKNKNYWFSRTFGFSKLTVCSQIWLHLLHTYTNYKFLGQDDLPLPLYKTTPDNLDDCAELPHNRAMLVHEQRL